MEVLLMYLWLKLDTINSVCCLFLFISLPVFAFYCLYCVIENEGFAPSAALTQWRNKRRWPSMYNNGNRDPGPIPETVGILKSIPKKLYVGWVIALLLVLFLPSSKEAAYMVGAHYAVMAAESPEAQKIVSVIRKKANDYLDEQLSGKTRDSK